MPTESSLTRKINKNKALAQNARVQVDMNCADIGPHNRIVRWLVVFFAARVNCELCQTAGTRLSSGKDLFVGCQCMSVVEEVSTEDGQYLVLVLFQEKRHVSLDLLPKESPEHREGLLCIFCCISFNLLFTFC